MKKQRRVAALQAMHPARCAMAVAVLTAAGVSTAVSEPKSPSEPAPASEAADRAVPALRRALNGDNDLLADRAADALGRLRATIAAPSLLRRLNRPTGWQQTALALARLGDRRTASAVIGKLKETDAQSDRVEILMALAAAMPTSTNAPRKLESLRLTPGESLPLRDYAEALARRAGVRIEISPKALAGRERDRAAWARGTGWKALLHLVQTLNRGVYRCSVFIDPDGPVHVVTNAEALALWEEWLAKEGVKPPGQASRPVEAPEEKAIEIGALINGVFVLRDGRDNHMGHWGLHLHPLASCLLYHAANRSLRIQDEGEVHALGKGLLADLTAPIDLRFEHRDAVPAKTGWRYVFRPGPRIKQYYAIRVLEATDRSVTIQWVMRCDAGSVFHPEGDLLDRQLGTVDLNPVAGPVWFECEGIRVCFEPTDPWHKPLFPRKKPKRHIRIDSATVRKVMDTFVKARPEYKWSRVSGTNIICIYPRGGSKLGWKPDKDALRLPIRNRSFHELLHDMGLRDRKIGAGYVDSQLTDEIKPDKRISIDLDGRPTARELLARMCWEYGLGLTFSYGYDHWSRNTQWISLRTPWR